MYRIVRQIARWLGVLLSFGSFVWFVVASSALTISLSFILFVAGVIITVRYWSDR